MISFGWLELVIVLLSVLIFGELTGFVVAAWMHCAHDAEECKNCANCKNSGLYQWADGSEGLACLEIEEDGFVRMAASVSENDYCSAWEPKGTED